MTNQVIQKDGYYISYNPAPMIGGQEGQETALVNENCKEGVFGRAFYILLGDFRKDYKKFKTYEECKKFYDEKILSNPELHGSWSSDC